MTKGMRLRILVFIVVWIPFIALKALTYVAGLFVVPFLWRYREIEYRDLPGWTRPWSNPEDWRGGPQYYANSLPKWWVDKHGISEYSFWRYHAIRNGANGLRSFEFLDLDIEMEKVKYVTPRFVRYYEPWYLRKPSEDFVNGFRVSHPKTVWYWCWQGWRAGYKRVHLWKDLEKHWWTDCKWWIFSGPKSGPRHLVIKLGWRIEPRDATVPIDPGGIRAEDAGFAGKAQFYRKG